MKKLLKAIVILALIVLTVRIFDTPLVLWVWLIWGILVWEIPSLDEDLFTLTVSGALAIIFLWATFVMLPVAILS